VKEEWADVHLEFMTEEEENKDVLLVYSDGSLSERKGKQTAGFRVIGYNQGRKVFESRGALGEHTEVFDAEMAGLHEATTEARWFIENAPQDNKLHKIAFYADNMGAIQRIFEGSPGKAQAHSRGFRKEICEILNADDETIIAISWCPRHHGIIGNEKADKLAKSGAKQPPERPNYKTQAYIAALNKHEMLEEWHHRWSNTPNLPSTWFQPANNIPPTLKPMERLLSTDWKTFSRLIQCQTGHAHTGEYYKCFIPTQAIECPCGAAVQTQQHITLECKVHH